MSNRRVRALGIAGEGDLERLERVGRGRCGDVASEDAGALARLLDCPEASARELQRAVRRKLAPRPASLLDLCRPSAPVPFGLPSVDTSLGGGLPLGVVAELAGPPGAGKSQVAVTLAAGQAAIGHAVVYVDTENKFSPKRALQILRESQCGPHPEAALRLIHVRKVSSLRELTDLLEDLDLQASEIQPSLVIIDSIACVVRSDATLSAVARSQLLSGMAGRLKQLAHRFSLSVVATNHIAFLNPGGLAGADSPPSAISALGNTWHHAVSFRFTLLPMAPGLLHGRSAVETSAAGPVGAPSKQAPNLRAFTISKSPMCPCLTVPCAITAAGVVESSA
ncbi:DNA repair protein RAD51-like protein 2 [Diplonema papillatum]|nr:DNA repair protein RAD51-like protein 2 [Diplonema papillatum]